MSLNSTGCGKQSAGFSLLEMVVAISILAIALGALYQAAGGATRNVRIDEKYAYGVELARSLLANNGRVPVSGLNSAGETDGGFKWHVNTQPINFGRALSAELHLYEIKVSVGWRDGDKQREVVLDSVVEGVEL
jgi:general secretion pathway protein I